MQCPFACLTSHAFLIFEALGGVVITSLHSFTPSCSSTDRILFGPSTPVPGQKTFPEVLPFLFACSCHYCFEVSFWANCQCGPFDYIRSAKLKVVVLSCCIYSTIVVPYWGSCMTSGSVSVGSEKYFGFLQV